MSRPQPALIVFAQHGCPACESYVPRVKRVHSLFRDVPLRVYDLASDQHALAFADQLGGIKAIPTTFVVDREGKLQRHVGALPDQQIRALLGSCR